MTTGPTISVSQARQLAITRQGLAGNHRPNGILDLVRRIGCLQLDPINVVARSHLLVLWSRLGTFDRAELDRLLWKDRALFEYWAHAASIVLTEDYPLHAGMMRTWIRRKSPWAKRFGEWADQNRSLRRHVLAELRHKGPVASRTFEDRASETWQSTGWTRDRNVGRMLDYLWTTGRVMVAGRAGNEKLWDLAERCLPPWTPRERLTQREITRRAVQRSLRALGVARPRDIANHFIRGRYVDLPRVLKELERVGIIVPLSVVDGKQAVRGSWYIHADDLPLVEELGKGAWAPRSTVLSPFDNLICDRARSKDLFGFDFRMEIYVPAGKRQHGYYVLPFLHGDRFAGRVDLALDRAQGRLVVRAVHAEPRIDREAGRALAVTLKELADFLGAQTIEYGRVPSAWHKALVADK
ncbi:MAG TPA: crosslink repair DNA glycosylase YcaQ family protein [Candidatus Eisenbacteria bacterium]|nr:crosslink repair DNA glycosylase YcaQ family protein [Candidatus Eisenbacteria bacterium]